MCGSDTDTLEYIFIIVLSIILCSVCYWAGGQAQRKIIANELCNRQQYDFCVVQKNIQYDIKEDKDVFK